MIIAIDVHYRDKVARTVSIEFENWEDKIPLKINVIELDETPEYVSGEFYKRELPCILEVLKLSDLQVTDIIIIDGYVVLDDKGKNGLGGYLYDALDQKIPIVGVAKKRFHSIDKKMEAIYRGESKKQLYITCLGGNLTDFAQKIIKMDGNFRIPTLLKILDTKTKERITLL